MGAGGESAAIAMKPTTMKKASVRIPLGERFPTEDSPFVRTGIWRSAVLMESLVVGSYRWWGKMGSPASLPICNDLSNPRSDSLLLPVLLRTGNRCKRKIGIRNLIAGEILRIDNEFVPQAFLKLIAAQK